MGVSVAGIRPFHHDVGGASRYVGRVGALAGALGVGALVAFAPVAAAETEDVGSSSTPEAAGPSASTSSRVARGAAIVRSANTPRQRDGSLETPSATPAGTDAASGRNAHRAALGVQAQVSDPARAVAAVVTRPANAAPSAASRPAASSPAAAVGNSDTAATGGKAAAQIAVTASATQAPPSFGDIIQYTLFHKSPTASPSQSPGQSPMGVVSGSLNAVSAGGGAVSYVLAEGPSRGSVQLADNGSYIYAPGNDLAIAGGVDSFRVTIDDGVSYRLNGIGGLIQGLFITLAQLVGVRQPDTITVSVPVTVAAINRAPALGPTTVSTPNPSTGEVLGQINATDPNGDPLSYTKSADPSKGIVTVEGANGSFVYSPTGEARHAAAKQGAGVAAKTDIFQVLVSDGRGGNTATTVTVAIGPQNEAPVVNGVTVGSANPSNGRVTGSLAVSDSDGDALEYTVVSGPTKGSLSLTGTGSFTYEPTVTARRNAALAGAPAGDLSDSFTIAVSDGYGGLTSKSINVEIDPAVSVYLTGDVRRDPSTGAVGLRTIFPETQTQPGTERPGYLNWLLLGPANGAVIGFPSDVATWDNLYLVGTVGTFDTYNSAQSLPTGSILRNPQNGAIAIRTIFDETDPFLTKSAWNVGTVNQGAQLVQSSSVNGWEILLLGNSQQ